MHSPAEGRNWKRSSASPVRCLPAGASISEFNTVRRHLSAIKGQTAGCTGVRHASLTLLISDIPGDDPALVASGPTLGDASTCSDALGVPQRYGIEISAYVRLHRRGRWESVKSDDPRATGHQHQLISCAMDQMPAARVAAGHGLDPPCTVRCHGKARGARMDQGAREPSPRASRSMDLRSDALCDPVRRRGHGHGQGRDAAAATPEFALPALAMALGWPPTNSRLVGGHRWPRRQRQCGWGLESNRTPWHAPGRSASIPWRHS